MSQYSENDIPQATDIPSTDFPFSDEPSDNNESPAALTIHLKARTFNDPEYYRRLGFYAALDTVNNPSLNFQKLLKDQETFVEDRRHGVEDYYKHRTIRFEYRIDEFNKKIISEKEKLEKHLKELNGAITKESELKNLVIDLETMLSEEKRALGKRKETMVEESINAVRKQLQLITQNYSQIYKERFAINLQTFNDNTKPLQYKANVFQKLKDSAEENWGRLNDKIKLLGLEGVNPFLANWLYYAGIGVATICGAYFFAIFALQKELNDENVSFFFLTGIWHFIQNILPPHWALGYRFLAISFGFIAFAGLLLFITWYCYRLLKKMQEPTTNKEVLKVKEPNYFIEATNDKNFLFELRSKSDSFYGFLLDLLPFIIVVGVSITVVFLGLQTLPAIPLSSVNPHNPLNSLDISITGATIGIILTLMVAGIAYLYQIKVIEPRKEKAGAKNAPFKNNIEFIIAILFFFIGTFSLLLVNKGDQQLVLIEYVAILLSNGFLLGFALRLKGIFGSLRFLENKIIILVNAVQDNSRPRPLNLTDQEDKVFSKEYFSLLQELFMLSKMKARQGSIGIGAENTPLSIVEKSPLPPDRPKPILIKFLWRNKNGKVRSSGVATMVDEKNDIEKWEERLYPENYAIIQDLNDKWERLCSEYNSARENTRQLLEENTAYANSLKEHISRYEQAINDTGRVIEKDIFEKSKALTLIHFMGGSIQADIREGFNLGTWFRKEVDPNELSDDPFKKAQQMSPSEEPPSEDMGNNS